jgi:hypothetical protein
MKYRKLRIAWSVGWGILCLMLVGFWVRSFSCWDDCWLKLTSSEFVHGISCEGRMILWFERGQLKKWLEFEVDPAAKHRSPGQYERHRWCSLYVSPSGNTRTVCLAHCVLVMLTAALAAIPWCPTRFSVRGLFVATTVVAVIIGGVTWADSFY